MDGCQALYAAAKSGHLDIVKALLDAGANANQAAVCERMCACACMHASPTPHPACGVPL
jgi:ankyrin repeat protein